MRVYKDTLEKSRVDEIVENLKATVLSTWL